MKKLITYAFLIVILCSRYQAFAQEYKNNKSFTDFFYIKIASNKDQNYLLYDVDSMKNDPYYNEICSSLWAFNQYLFSNYSIIPSKDSIMAKLIPDTLAVQKQFCQYLNEDSSFRNIFNKALNKEKIAPIHIDSLLKITSRFYLVHRLGDEVVFHLCVVVNEALDLIQNENSPYYNAFCFMTIRNNTNNWDFFERATEPFKTELNDSITDERLEEIKNAVFEYIACDKELRKNLLNEYGKKKSYLNFEIIE